MRPGRVTHAPCRRRRRRQDRDALSPRRTCADKARLTTGSPIAAAALPDAYLPRGRASADDRCCRSDPGCGRGRDDGIAHLYRR
ncbi:hypothetical protein AB5I41_04915 [Sphingomonas sp. MMS24-JH45]